jgi:5-methyltetrahydrofolate--homocysteine methyltransferase
MHSFMETTGPALDVLADRWPGPKMAYAETGAFRNPDWVFEQVVSVEEYAHAVDGWVRDQGVQIIGGCCGTGPDHIRALHERFCQD